MSKKECQVLEEESPPSSAEIKATIRKQCEELINYCEKGESEEKFYHFEKSIQELIREFSCLLIQLHLISFHERLDYSKWVQGGFYSMGKAIPRHIKTIYGSVRYWRVYLIKKGGGGFYPLDLLIGLTKDGFSPWVISLSTKLATRVSFSTSVLLFKCFLQWSPSSSSIQSLVQGMGRDSVAYMEQVAPPEGDGEVLVIEVDGKATPTAKADELKKRRGKQKSKKKSCTCPRHRGKNKRQHRCKKKKEKGNKSKNGRSITLVAMYTLKKGEDGKLHGPINKKIWGSYAPRKVMIDWVGRQATKRGFPPDTQKRVHIVVDGEICLRQGLEKLFKTPTFALDICHLEEKLWEVGRTFHKKGSKELDEWVEAKRELLYTGQAAELLSNLKVLKLTLSTRAKRDKPKREALKKLIFYMKNRLDMMDYQKLIEEDLVIASGIIEGAARYVVGQRMDCGGMRWIPQRAEALLHLRCIELNGDWDHFFQWGYDQWIERMENGEKVLIRKETPSGIIKPKKGLSSNEGEKGKLLDAA